jgi:VanZ family protein
VKKILVEYWAPIVIWLLTMFFFSTDMFSSAETSKIVVPVLAFFFPGLSHQQLELWHGVVRKCAHITEYFILTVFTYRGLRHDDPDVVQGKLRIIVFVLFVAIFDELHQRLTASRTASPVDVGYDCLGAVWALWLITNYENRRLRTHSVL